jgi:DNA-binding MarR family transcriptional regulator
MRPNDDGELLQLEEFLPYRLSILTNRISRQLSNLYAQRFELSIPEWRVLAMVARHPGASAELVCRKTAMDKVAVSRAVARLLQSRRLERKYAADDKRRTVLRLSAQGQRVYRRIVPLARKFETEVISDLTQRDRNDLQRVLAKLDAAVARLER